MCLLLDSGSKIDTFNIGPEVLACNERSGLEEMG
jgi:hypothetical protein